MHMISYESYDFVRVAYEFVRDSYDAIRVAYEFLNDSYDFI